MSNAHILVVKDEQAIAMLVRFNLEKAGFGVQVAETVADAKAIIKQKLPDLVLLDWMLPDVSGVEFAKALRSDDRTKTLPLIMLTARSEESDKELGLNLGADDYITKPFSPRELISRINALLRRCAPQKTEQIIEIAWLVLDPNRQLLIAKGEVITLSPSEFKLLHFFMTHPNRIYSRRQLLDLVWGDHVFIEERTVDVHIRRLRKGLESAKLAKLIETVHGCGYQFLPEQGEL